MKILITFLLVAGVFFSIAARAETEFVQNGSFDDALTNWEKTGVGKCPLDVVQVELPGGDKANALRAAAEPEAGQSPWANNVVNTIKGELVAGGQLTLSFWARSPEGTRMGIALQPRAGSEQQIWENDLHLTDAWQRYEFTVPLKTGAEEGAGRLQFTVGYEKAVIEIAQPSLRAD